MTSPVTARRRRNSLNYGDLLNLTAKVLRENPQVRRALQQKYRHLFVDEFQDTDPVQAEIVFLLAIRAFFLRVSTRKSLYFRPPASTSVRTLVNVLRGPLFGISDQELFEFKQAGGWFSIFAGAAGAADERDVGVRANSARTRQANPHPGPSPESPVPGLDWRTVRLRSGALFVVGDPKQPIYRFRRADIEIYNTARARFSEPALGRVVPLTTNFRSVSALCGWSNTVFEKQFPPTPTVHSPQFAPLDPKKDAAAATSKRPSGLFTLTHTCGEAKEVPALDAAAIARYMSPD